MDSSRHVIESWNKHPPELTKNSSLIGGKAIGLFILPQAWTPPFIVLTKNFYQSWVKTKNAFQVISNLPSFEQDLILNLLEGSKKLSKKGKKASSKIIVRSNSPLECLNCRGKYKSYHVNNTLKDISRGIDAIFTLDAGNPLFSILQVLINPSWNGHMSNERRVTRDKNKWLVEGILTKDKNLKQQFIIARTNEISEGLIANNSKMLMGNALTNVAGLLSKDGHRRYHCEWVWDGNNVFIVQADEDNEPDFSIDNNANNYLLSNEKTAPKFSPKSVIKHYKEIETKNWKKLQCPSVFNGLSMPTADVFILSGRDWVAHHERSKSLISDLSKLCEYPLVVRCDYSSHLDERSMLLPTSPVINEIEGLLSYLKRISKIFYDRSILPDNWAFLFSHLVPARASAMVHARPFAQRVQIDALWGFPDGLLYLPHDTWYVDTKTKKINKRIRFKGQCLIPEENKWSINRVAPPLDWKPVLNPSEIHTITKWSLDLANFLNKEIQLMVLSRIGGNRGKEACLPWHFTDLKIPSFQDSIRFLPNSARVATIDSFSSIEQYRSAENDRSISGYLIRPSSEYLRDDKLLESAAALAFDRRKPLYFEGSILSHSYYIMARSGATIVPIIPDEPKGKKIKYDKLVRDLIPVVIERGGGIQRVREIPKTDAIKFLSQKLIEEAFEVNQSDTKEIVKELADVLEVVDALQKQIGISKNELEKIKSKKREERGGFDRLIFLEETDIRPLKNKLENHGMLPLFNDDALSLYEHRERIGRLIDVMEIKQEPFEISFNLPLIPPIMKDGIKNKHQIKQNGLTLLVEYANSRLSINIRKEAKKPYVTQLQLFPEHDDGV